MTAVSRGPQSVSRFLRSYAPDTFEWEIPEYVPQTRRFIWAKPIALGSHSSVTPTWSLAAESRKENSTVSTYSYAAALSDGPPSSPGSESLSDMSISLSDAGSFSGRCFSILPPMDRTRAATPITPDARIDASSGFRTLSDMSLTSSPSSSFPLQLSEDFDGFLHNMPKQTAWDSPLNRAPLDYLSSLAREMKSGDSAIQESDDNDPDAASVSKILEWTASLFVSVASSVLSYSIQPGVDDVPRPTCLNSRDPSASFGELDEVSFTPSSRNPDVWSSAPELIVKIKSTRTEGPAKDIQANPLSILMPSFIEHGGVNPEQPTTAKPVCMWGRRLERIPKVRLAGQQEAVYCFDSRKQRQKQKARDSDSAGPGDSRGGNRHATPSRVSSSGAGISNKERQQPTQIFYRARPLDAQFVRRELPATPVDAVKITQGQVLLQNIRPVRFNATGGANFQSGGGFQPQSSPSTTGRLPLAPRTNGIDQGRRQTNGATAPASLLLVKKIPGRGFL